MFWVTSHFLSNHCNEANVITGPGVTRHFYFIRPFYSPIMDNNRTADLYHNCTFQRRVCKKKVLLKLFFESVTKKRCLCMLRIVCYCVMCCNVDDAEAIGCVHTLSVCFQLSRSCITACEFAVDVYTQRVDGELRSLICGVYTEKHWCKHGFSSIMSFMIIF